MPDGKCIAVSVHAIKRAREKEISFPDQVYATLCSGKMKRFAKNMVKFVRRTKHGSIICIGEDLGYVIMIKTIERGN